jgi:flagellar hook protein FlgE
MLNAIYTSLSGMDAYSKGLQTISDNVANLNSNGYKQTILTFGDLVNTNMPTPEGAGVIDPGDGVHIASSTTDFNQGQLNPTSNALDLGLQGTGFLVELSKTGDVFYTRTGSFAVDKDGFISDQATGNRLAVLDASGHPVAVNVNSKQSSPPAATTKVTFSQNLSSSATTASVSNVTVTDDHGGQTTWTVNFAKSTQAGQTDAWTATITDASGNTVGTAALNFNGSVVDSSTATSTINFTPTGADPMTVTLDFSGVTSFSSGTTSTIQASADGNAAGTLSTVTVDNTGQILLTYTNQKTAQEGAVAVANFQNPELLTKLNNGLYKSATGPAPSLSASNTNGVGTVTPKVLEASNVDLTTEFGDLILLQRGFQACSEVVSVSNDMIQQLFAIRGQ